MPKSLTDFVSGIGNKVSDIFSPGRRPDDVRSPAIKAPKPDLPATALGAIRDLVYKYDEESTYEKLPLAQKWARNTLIFQGYHDLDVSLVTNALEASIDDYADYGFPNNRYRSLLKYGQALYVKNPPQFNFAPTADDPDSRAIAQAAQKAMEVIKRSVDYDQMRAIEALYLRLYGNAFRYSYYSLDPRFGMVTVPIMGQTMQAITDPNTGQSFQVPVPTQTSEASYPKGREVTETVHPLEVYMRAAAENLFDSPYLLRKRVVDKKRLQAVFPDTVIESGGRWTQDLAVHYKQMLSELSGDPLDPSQQYANTTKDDGALFIQAWLRPSVYYDDQRLLNKFPDGMYVAISGKTVLETRNESIEDHWVHFPWTRVPGRVWGDGDDDLIPKQLQLNVVDQMIAKNVAYNSVPQTWVDGQRVDKDKIVNDPGEVNVVKTGGARPVSDAVYHTPGMSLSQEVFLWRNQIIEDMDYHAGIFGSAIGDHQAGVNTLGGQQMFASRAESNQSPAFLMYKKANEDWARQMLKIAAENWLDERIYAVQGLNGTWEFEKLRGAALNPDSIIIEARIAPVDFSEQQNFTQAVAAGVLDVSDPRVQRKALELYNLPPELDKYSLDSKAQWKEIERMKQGQPVQPRPFIDNDAIHIDVCRTWLNSDQADREPPEIVQIVYAHMMQHIQMQMQMAMMQQAQMQQVQGPGQGQQPGQPGQPTPEKARPSNGPVKEQPPNKGAQHRRAMKGQAARPKGQPSSGNQHNRRPV